MQLIIDEQDVERLRAAARPEAPRPAAVALEAVHRGAAASERPT